MCVCVEHGIGPSIDRPVRSYVINKKSNHTPLLAHGADTCPCLSLARGSAINLLSYLYL